MKPDAEILAEEAGHLKRCMERDAERLRVLALAIAGTASQANEAPKAWHPTSTGLYLRPSAVAGVRYTPGGGTHNNELLLVGGQCIPVDPDWALSALEQLHQSQGYGQTTEGEHGPAYPAGREALIHLPLEGTDA